MTSNTNIAATETIPEQIAAGTNLVTLKGFFTAYKSPNQDEFAQLINYICSPLEHMESSPADSGLKIIEALLSVNLKPEGGLTLDFDKTVRSLRINHGPGMTTASGPTNNNSKHALTLNIGDGFQFVEDKLAIKLAPSSGLKQTNGIELLIADNKALIIDTAEPKSLKIDQAGLIGLKLSKDPSLHTTKLNDKADQQFLIVKLADNSGLTLENQGLAIKLSKDFKVGTDGILSVAPEGY